MVEKNAVTPLRNSTIITTMSSEVNDLFFTPKPDPDAHQTLAMVETNEMLNEPLDASSISADQFYFEETYTTEEIVPELNSPYENVDMTKVKQEWSENDASPTPEVPDEDPDEETIATFVTSTGQQLALYAVEDSEDVFAVAVYDESGQSPTNFQFVLKADVERLIEEGAVKTVKKPSQIKKQTYQGEIAVPKREQIPPVESKSKLDSVKSEFIIPDNSSKMPSNASEDLESQFEEDIDHFQDMMDKTMLYTPTVTETPVKRVCEVPKPIGEEERTTVQYLLLDDQSDSELTFDDIEKSLKTFGKSPKQKSLLKTRREPSPMSLDINHFILSPPSSPVKSPSLERSPVATKSTRKILQHTVLKQKHVPNALLARKSTPGEVSKNQESTAQDYVSTDVDEPPEQSKDSPDSSSKIKRPRKQQLITVNRADSEIIIQPASMVSEEEEEVPKKRGKRKKKRFNRFREAKKAKPPIKKRIPVSRRSRIEIIDIDDENEGKDDSEGVTSIEEITIEEGKEKYSSDKENEVIMVGDSDEEVEEVEEIQMPATSLKCSHCLRSFRHQRALDTHSRICPKSPESERRSTRRMNRRSSSSDSIVTEKKEYSCKMCDEKFDVVVALARHVRSHYAKKDKKEKIEKMEKADNNHRQKEEKKPKNEIEKKNKNESRPLTLEKRIFERNEFQEIHKIRWIERFCLECGKWFTTMNSLMDHRRQHVTRLSEKQSRRCQICRKSFPSRIMFIRHVIQTHGNRKEPEKKRLECVVKPPTPKPPTPEKTIRKRGRPRKL